MTKEEKDLRDSLFRLVEDYDKIMELIKEILDKYSEYYFGIPIGFDRVSGKIYNPKKPQMELIQRTFRLLK